MTECKVHVVCCESAPDRWSQIVEITQDWETIKDLALTIAEQDVPAGEARDLHNAAPHPEHGLVTYLQQVHEGGFTVLVGPPGQLRETYFGPGSLVAFQDDQGPGHASRVGSEGVRRTLRVLRGHLIKVA